MKIGMAPLLLLVPCLFFQCDKLKQQAIDISEKSARSGAELLQGVNKGVNEAFTEIKPKIDPRLAKLGVKVNYAARKFSGTRVSLYCVFEKPFTGTFMLKVFRKGNREIGRCPAQVTGLKGEARFAEFDFDERTPFYLADSYTLELE